MMRIPASTDVNEIGNQKGLPRGTMAQQNKSYLDSNPGKSHK